MVLSLASNRQPFVTQMNSFGWAAPGRNACLFICGCSEGFARLPSPSACPPIPTATPFGQRWFLIISPEVICHLSGGKWSAACVRFGTWMVTVEVPCQKRGNKRLSGSVDSYSQRECCFLEGGCFLFVAGLGYLPLHVSHSASRRVITELC